MRLPLPKLKTVAEAYNEAADLLETNPEKAYWILRKIVKLGNNHDIVLRDLSLACLLTRRYGEAVEYADLRARRGREAGNVLQETGGLTQRGEAEDASGRHAEAAQVLRSAVVLLDPAKPDHTVPRWVALGDLGAALAHAGQFGEAYQAQEEAYAIALASEHAEQSASIAADLVVLSVNLGLIDRAIEWSQTAEEHLRSAESPKLMTTAGVYESKALALSAARRPDEASEAISRAQAAGAGTPHLRQHLLVSAIEINREAGNLSQALTSADALLAQAGNDLRARALALSLRASIRLQQRRPELAIRDLSDGLKVRYQLGDSRGIAVILGNLARAHLQAGEPDQAARYVDESERRWQALAQNAPDEPGRAGLAEIIRPVISQTRQEVCLATGDVDGALAAAELGRQGPLVDRLRELRPAAAVGLDSPGADRIRQLARAVNATLVVYAAHLDPERLQPQRSLASEIRRVQVWAVTAGGQIRQATIPGPQLLAALQTEGPAGYAEAGRLLLHPVADCLPIASGGRVIVLPAVFMWAIPFAALLLPDGEPLARYCPVSYAPSLHALEYLAAARSARQSGPWRPESVLALGDPENPQLPDVDGTYRAARSLPGARRGAQAVADRYGAVPLLGAQCTVPEVLARMPGADLIHVEAHADVDAHPRFDRPPGMVALTPSASDNGLLTTDMIESTAIRARLVVLAACSTGLGLPASEGIRGLVRAFFSAGADGVVASLWPVPDYPAFKIMQWFHAELLETGDPATALRLAALAARDRWGQADPGVWQAFVLYGL